MNTIKLPYGKSYRTYSTNAQVDILGPVPYPGIDQPLECLQKALEHDIALDIQNIKSVAIAINDKTRSVPHEVLLPPLLNKLSSLGIVNAQICFYIATGTHLPMQPEEFKSVLPESIIQNYQVRSHDTDDQENLIYLGGTSRETPVYINKSYYQSDLKLAVGNIEPHHFAGFSGGSKSVSIGLAGRETINSNHKLLLNENATSGIFSTNPLQQDIEEIGIMAGVHYVLNVVLNQDKDIVASFFGKPDQVMKAGVPLSRSINQFPVNQLYDVVITSAGGYPKDINFYQSQKAITNAARIVRQGGIIILLAACPEGGGSAAYDEFMQRNRTLEDIFFDFDQYGFRVGPHKAFQVAKILQKATIIIVSEMPPELSELYLLIPAKSLENAMEIAKSQLGTQQINLAILPQGGIALPVYSDMENIINEK